MEELSERLKELVTMKMNEAKEASEKTEDKKCEREKEEEGRRRKRKKLRKKETVDDDTNTAPRSASSSEEFEFKTIQKAETVDFAAKAAIERENKLMVSEAMAMIVLLLLRLHITEIIRCQSMDNKSQKNAGLRRCDDDDAKTSLHCKSNRRRRVCIPRVSYGTRCHRVRPTSNAILISTNQGTLTIFAKLMGKIITDTLEFTDEAARKAAAAHSPPQIIRTMSPAEPRISPTLLKRGTSLLGRQFEGSTRSI